MLRSNNSAGLRVLLVTRISGLEQELRGWTNSSPGLTTW